MTEHAQEYSLAGLADAVIVIGFNKDIGIRENAAANFLIGNHMNGILFGSGGEAAMIGVHSMPEAAAEGMGNVLTYGRTQTQLIGMNLSGNYWDAVPDALSRAGKLEATAVKGGLKSVGKALNLGLSLVERVTIDATLTTAEALNCAGPQGHN